MHRANKALIWLGITEAILAVAMVVIAILIQDAQAVILSGLLASVAVAMIAYGKGAYPPKPQ